MAETAESLQQRIALLEQQLAAERERSRLASLHSADSSNATSLSSPSTVTVVTLHCSRSRILLGELCVYLSISVSQSQSQMFQIWDAD